MTAVLLALALAVPLTIAALPIVRPWRDMALTLLPLAPLPALAAALVVPQGTTLTLPDLLLGAAIGIDGEARLFLVLAGLLWSAAGLYAKTTLADDERRGGFAAFWCLTLTGNLGVFLAQDVATFYVTFAMVSLGAYPLVVHYRSDEAISAGRVYITLAVLGEVLILAGLLFATVGLGSIAIADVRAALPLSPNAPVVLGLLIAGLGIKAGLVPLHVWLPLAHPVAPTPASAVLSGAIVKAGIFGLMQFLPLGAGLDWWATLLMSMGIVTAYYGILVGLTQRRPKTILAYSTLSQMGLVMALLGSGLAAGPDGVAADVVLAAATLYALHHGLAKGALFMAVGVAEKAGRDTLPWVMAAAALMALAIAGLPFTGGALAKLALKGAFPPGPGLVLVTFSAIGTTLLLGRFILQLAQAGKDAARAAPPAGSFGPWLFVTALALVLPWLAYAAATGHDPRTALEPGYLWDNTWPILAAAFVAVLAAAEPGSDLKAPALLVGRSIVDAIHRLPRPRLPEPTLAYAIAERGGRLAEQIESGLVRWSIAGTVLLALALGMIAALAF
jgi:hydrogenase-4 component B